MLKNAPICKGAVFPLKLYIFKDIFSQCGFISAWTAAPSI